MIIEITHKTGSYPIYIENQLVSNPETWRKHILGKKIMLIRQKSTDCYLPKILASLQGFEVDQLLIPDGESQKNWQNLQKIWDELIRCHHHRDTTIIAIGGGVITDLVGFAAACYLRGVNYLSIPTTLLAQVDASIGGKTAINHPLGKNLIGAFYPPQAVIIDPETLLSLPDRHFRAGLAEIIKAALIQDRDFFEFLENNLEKLLQKDLAILKDVIYRACQIKASIVMKDEKERYERQLLNFGHTFGHAIEQALNYEDILHGEAVSIGMVLAANLSMALGYFQQDEYDRMIHLLVRAGLPIDLPKSIQLESLIPFLHRDKKNFDRHFNFILLNQIGQGMISSVDINQLSYPM